MFGEWQKRSCEMRYVNQREETPATENVRREMLMHGRVCVCVCVGELIHGRRTVRTSLEQRYRMEPVCLLGRWWISPTLQHEVCVYACVCALASVASVFLSDVWRVCVVGGRACLSAVLTCSFEWVIIACSVAGPRRATLCICVEPWCVCSFCVLEGYTMVCVCVCVFSFVFFFLFLTTKKYKHERWWKFCVWLAKQWTQKAPPEYTSLHENTNLLLNVGDCLLYNKLKSCSPSWFRPCTL